MFSHLDSSTSNCVHEKICGADLGNGKLVMNTGKNCNSNSMCGKGEVCCVDDKDFMGNVCLKDGEIGSEDEKRTCHVNWDKDDERDWFKLGKCLCAPGYTYVNDGDGIEDGTKLCIPDQCYSFIDEPGNSGFTGLYKKGDQRLCECPDDSNFPISCPGDLPNINQNQGNEKMFNLVNICKNFPMCISDPCADYGAEYVKQAGAVGSAGACKNCPSGTIQDTTSTNWTGSYCDDPCKNNGPCGTGPDARGRCRVVDRGDKKDIECVGGTAYDYGNCENRSQNRCSSWYGCYWKDDICQNLPAGSGGCPCPWFNECNQHQDKESCNQAGEMCSWLTDVTPSRADSRFSPGQRCVLSDKYLDKERKIDESNTVRDYTNQCTSKMPGVSNPGSTCILGENNCCNSERTGMNDCDTDWWDHGGDLIKGINIGTCPRDF